MKKNIPLVSVLLLSYNHEEFIEESIKSVFALKSKNYNIELRIIDDGSTDKTQDIICTLKDTSPIPMYVDFKKHIGIKAISRNLNELILDAKGEFITFLASDDSYVKENFFTRLNYLLKDKNLDLVYSNGVSVVNGIESSMIVDKNMQLLLNENNAQKVYANLITNVPSLCIQALIIKTELLKNIGGFDEDLIADDWVLNIKIFKYISEKKGNFLFYDTKAFLRNIHDSNTSKDLNGHFERLSQVINKYYDKSYKNIALSKLYREFGIFHIVKFNFLKGLSFLIKSIQYKIKL